MKAVRIHKFIIVICVAIVIAICGHVEAQTITKANNADNLDQTTSWLLGAVPNSGSIALWDSTVLGANTVSLGSNLSWLGLQLTNPGGAVTINAGGSITLGSFGVDLSTASQDLTINANLLLAASHSWSVNSGRLLTIGGAVDLGSNALTINGAGNTTVTGNISNSGSLTKSGTGLLLLSGLNTYSGGTYVNGGIVRITTATSLPSSGANVIAGATFDVNAQNLTGGNARSFTIAGTGAAGQVGALVNTGGGTEASVVGLTLTGDATVGSTGTKLNFYGAINGGGNTLTIGGSSETNFRPSSSLTSLSAIVVNTTGSGRLRLEGDQSWAGPYIVNSGAILDTWATRTIAGSVTLNGGVLEANGPGGNTATWNGAISVPADSTVTANQRIDFFGAISGTGTITKYGGNVFNIRGGITSLGGLVINTGRIRFEGAGLGAWAGTITINGGTLSPWVSASTSANITLAGGALSIENPGTVTWNGNVTVNSSSTIDATAGNHVVNGAISGAGTLNKTGGNTVHLSGSVTGFTGPIVNGGGTIQVNTTGSETLTGTISGAGALAKTGAGTLTLSGNNSFTGGTYVNAGLLRPTQAVALPGAATITAGATFDVNALDFNTAPKPFTIAGTGAAGQIGALVNTTAGPEAQLNNVTLSADATIGTTGSKLNIRGTVDGGGNTLTIAGTQETNLRINNQLTNLGGVVVNTTGGGRFRLESSQNWGGTYTVNGGSTIDTWSTRTVDGNVDLVGGRVEANGPAGLTSTWNGNFSLAGNSTINANGGTLVINGTLSGTGTLTKGGGNPLILNGDVTGFTGPINNNTGGVQVDTSTSTTLSGTIIGAAGLTKTGTGLLTLGGNNTYTGGTIINGGTVSINADNRVGASSGGVTLDGGALRDTFSGQLTWNHVITVGANGGTIDSVNAGTAGKFYINAVNLITGSGTLTKTGPGMIQIPNAQNFSGDWYLDGGFIEAQDNSALGSGGITVNSGAELVIGSSYTIGNPLTLTAGSNLSTDNGTTAIYSGPINATGDFTVRPRDFYTGANPGRALTISGTISGAGGMTVDSTGATSAGTVTLSAVNSYSGGTTINAGVLVINSNSALGAGGGTLAFGGGTLRNTALFTIPRAITLNAGGGTLALGAPLTLTGPLTGGTGLTSGGSDLILNPATPWNLGTFTLTGNRVFINNANAIANNAALQIQNGRLVFQSGSTATAPTNPMTITAGSGIANRTSSPGTLVLSTANVTLPTAGLLTFNLDDQPTRDINISGDYGTLTGLLTVQVGGGNATVGAVTVGGNIYGTGGLTKTSTGALILGGNNTYTGSTTISGGTLQIGTGGASGSLASSDIDNNGHLIFDRTGATTYAGPITGTGTLTKNGTGTLTLTAASSYTGATTINGGTLKLGGSGAINSTSTLTINGATFIQDNNGTAFAGPIVFTSNGGTLAGTGAIDTSGAGGVNIGNNVVLSPGNSPAGQNYAGTMNWADGGKYIWEINNWHGIASNNWDFINLDGALNFSGLSSNMFTIEVVGLTLGGSPGLPVNFDRGESKMFPILNSGTLGIDAGFDPGFFTVTAAGFPSGSYIAWTVESDGNTLWLSYTAMIPEPTTLALLGLGGLLLMWGRRLRRTASRK